MGGLRVVMIAGYGSLILIVNRKSSGRRQVVSFFFVTPSKVNEILLHDMDGLVAWVIRDLSPQASRAQVFTPSIRPASHHLRHNTNKDTLTDRAIHLFAC